MRKDSVENKIKRGEYPQKEEFEKYYILENHSQNDTAKYFGITRSSIQSLVEFWNIRKDQSHLSKINSIKARSNSRSVEYKINTGLYPNREEFLEFYVKNNHSREETAKHFNVSIAAITSLCEFWNIHKTQKEISSTKKKTCLERFGCASNLQSEETKAKIRNTCLERYGVDTILKSIAVKEKIRQVLIEKYGFEHVLQNEECKKKLHSTVSEKWGVEWPCQIALCEKARNGSNSGPNKDFEIQLKENNISYEREYHLEGYSYDFKIDDKLIEIDPWFTHQSSFDIKFAPKSKEYHNNKTEVAASHGMHCIHIFDWDSVDKIIQLFLLPKQKHYARECEVRIVDPSSERQFLVNYHLQGYVHSQVCIGLYYQDKLLQLMSFGKPRYNKVYDYELLRLCSCETVVGGAQKIFKYFLSHYKCDSIISYCDLSKFDGSVYDSLGFSLLRKSIGKHWYSGKLHKHITDNLLRQQGFDRLLGDVFGEFGKGSSNETLMLDHGFVEIYDAGQATYIYDTHR